MAYLVLAAGAVMVLIGALAIITGYPIIQVERGWSTVIAGTTLLAGGVVTMVLALVLRALMDLRLATPEEARGAFEDAGGAPTADRAIDLLFASRAEPAMADASSGLGAAMLGTAAVTVPVAALAPHDTDDANVELHHADAVAHEPEPYADHSPTATSGDLAEAHIDQTQVDQTHLDQTNLDQTHLDQTYTAEPAHEGSLEAPPLDDWLDRAFADLHDPASPERSRDEHPAMDPLQDHAPATQLHDDHVEPHGEAYDRQEQTIIAEAPAYAAAYTEPAPLALEPTSAVIGRYESDGTAYTMYADGSIDAQSDVGVYRFASMAELKAFIEG